MCRMGSDVCVRGDCNREFYPFAETGALDLSGG